MATVETGAIVAELTGAIAVLDRAQQRATATAEYVGQVAAQAAGTGMAGVATALTGIRQQVTDLSTALADAAGCGREAVAAVRAVGVRTNPAEVGELLTTAVWRLDAMRSALVVAARRVAAVKVRVEVILRGAQPGPILNRLDSLRQYLVAAVGRGDAAKIKIEEAIAKARGLGVLGGAGPTSPPPSAPTGLPLSVTAPGYAPRDVESRPPVVYVEEVDAGEARVYAEIRRSVDDTAKIAEYTGIPQSKIEQIKEHLFYRQHDLAVGPGQVVRGNFSPDSEVAKLWPKAAAGTLAADETRDFHRLMAHEYVESSLMRQGMPYRSADPGAYHPDFGNLPNPRHHGAHDLAPLVDSRRDPFQHWPRVAGRPHPGITTIAADLSNLDGVIADILTARKMN